MSIIYILIPIAMLFVLIAFGVFFWAVKNDQFEDLERHSASILFDEDELPASKSVEPQKVTARAQSQNRSTDSQPKSDS